MGAFYTWYIYLLAGNSEINCIPLFNYFYLSLINLSNESDRKHLTYEFILPSTSFASEPARTPMPYNFVQNCKTNSVRVFAT